MSNFEDQKKGLDRQIPMRIGNLQAVIWHLQQGEDNGGISREALAKFLEAVKTDLESLDVGKY